ncbi:MAG: alpha-ketoglutarate-dependent dioxygenase AlkB family protein [Propionibacteriaceae bacterium]
MLFDDTAVPRPRRDLAPGATWVPDWLSVDQQAWLVGQFQSWAAGPVPARSATVRGHPMSVRTVCLGWHWRPYQYSREAVDVNGERVLPLPDWLVRLGQRAVAETTGSEEAGRAYAPDVALVNHYDASSRMGMHQDKDEHSSAPVVSLSIGDTCRFRFGNTQTRTKPYTDILLASGDLLVFGGESRMAYHGVTTVHPGSAPDGCGLTTGRINITLRETGLHDRTQ